MKNSQDQAKMSNQRSLPMAVDADLWAHALFFVSKQVDKEKQSINQKVVNGMLVGRPVPFAQKACHSLTKLHSLRPQLVVIKLYTLYELDLIQLQAWPQQLDGILKLEQGEAALGSGSLLVEQYELDKICKEWLPEVDDVSWLLCYLTLETVSDLFPNSLLSRVSCK